MSNRVYFGCGLLPGFVGLGILVLFQWATSSCETIAFK
jgi:hypothetical protein